MNSIGKWCLIVQNRFIRRFSRDENPSKLRTETHTRTLWNHQSHACAGGVNVLNCLTGFLWSKVIFFFTTYPLLIVHPLSLKILLWESWLTVKTPVHRMDFDYYLEETLFIFQWPLWNYLEGNVTQQIKNMCSIILNKKNCQFKCKSNCWKIHRTKRN